jgi:hypothetical protein
VGDGVVCEAWMSYGGVENSGERLTSSKPNGTVGA